MPLLRSSSKALRSATTIVDVGAATAPSTGQVLMATASTTATWQTPASGGSSEAYIYIREELSSGSHGGDFNSGSWVKRSLNTEVNDAGGHASLASNQITLAAGTYRFTAWASAFKVNSHKVRLANVTDSIYYYGSTEWIYLNEEVTTRSIVSGRFTIAGSKTFELQHRCTSTRATQGLGYASSIAVEVYSEIQLWKEL